MATRLQRLRHLSGVRTGVCHACGRHVPVTNLVTGEVEPFQGFEICSFCFGDMRFIPSPGDLHREFPVEIPVPDDDDFPLGDEVYWR